MQTKSERTNRVWHLIMEGALLVSSVACMTGFVALVLGHLPLDLYSALQTLTILSVVHGITLAAQHGWQRALITIAIGTFVMGILEIVIQRPYEFANVSDGLLLLINIVLVGGVPLGNVLNYLAHLRK